METKPLVATCQCGAVRLALTLPAKWSAHCHCTMCRRAHAAAFVTWVGFDAAQVVVEAGAEVLKQYASSDAATRSFCGQCGTMLLFEAERWAGEKHIPLACIDGEIDKKPQGHVFFDRKVPWVEVHDDLAKLGGPTGTARLRG